MLEWRNRRHDWLPIGRIKLDSREGMGFRLSPWPRWDSALWIWNLGFWQLLIWPKTKREK